MVPFILDEGGRFGSLYMRGEYIKAGLLDIRARPDYHLFIFSPEYSLKRLFYRLDLVLFMTLLLAPDIVNLYIWSDHH